jgi:hypothetical protein
MPPERLPEYTNVFLGEIASEFGGTASEYGDPDRTLRALFAMVKPAMELTLVEEFATYR